MWSRVSIAGVVAGVVAPFACTLPDLDLNGRSCPCTDGYVCDAATQTCVSGTGSTGAASNGGSAAGGEGVGGAGNSGAGASSAGGGGLGAGGGTPTAPVDWTTKMDALYTFEETDALGLDTSGNGPDLLERNRPDRSSTMFKEGSSALLLDGSNGLDAPSSSDFSPSAEGTMTWGAWLNMAMEPNGAVFVAVGKDGDNSGFAAESWLDHPNCSIGLGDGWSDAQSPQAWDAGEWIHLVCRYQHTTGTVETFVGGEFEAQSVGAMVSDGTVFTVSSPNYPFPGHIDEVFFSSGLLSDAAIARIHACGVDGSGCSCSATDPTAYASCGRAPPECAGLPPCNRPTP